MKTLNIILVFIMLGKFNLNYFITKTKIKQVFKLDCIIAVSTTGKNKVKISKIPVPKVTISNKAQKCLRCGSGFCPSGCNDPSR